MSTNKIYFRGKIRKNTSSLFLSKKRPYSDIKSIQSQLQESCPCYPIYLLLFGNNSAEDIKYIIKKKNQYFTMEPCRQKQRPRLLWKEPACPDGQTGLHLRCHMAVC